MKPPRKCITTESARVLRDLRTISFKCPFTKVFYCKTPWKSSKPAWCSQHTAHDPGTWPVARFPVVTCCRNGRQGQSKQNLGSSPRHKDPVFTKWRAIQLSVWTKPHRNRSMHGVSLSMALAICNAPWLARANGKVQCRCQAGVCDAGLTSTLRFAIVWQWECWLESRCSNNPGSIDPCNN